MTSAEECTQSRLLHRRSQPQGGGNHEPKILKPRVLGGFGKRCNNDTQWHQQNRIYDNEVAISVTTDFQPNYVDNEIRVRKLTPKECFRLMGFDDGDFEKARKVNSDSQLYKRAGNSIVVNVLEALFTQLRPYFRDDTD